MAHRHEQCTGRVAALHCHSCAQLPSCTGHTQPANQLLLLLLTTHCWFEAATAAAAAPVIQTGCCVFHFAWPLAELAMQCVNLNQAAKCTCTSKACQLIVTH
jgi:hypothetical protein